jgi:hypothetical protein
MEQKPFDKLTVPKPVNKFPAFYGTRRFITVFIKPSYGSLFSVRYILFTLSKMHCNIILRSTTRFPKRSFPFNYGPLHVTNFLAQHRLCCKNNNLELSADDAKACDK